MNARIIQVGGLPVSALTRQELAHRMVDDWRANLSAGRTLRPRLLFGANGQKVSMYGSSPEYRHLLDEADLMYADGMSVVNATRLLTRNPLPERVATTDFFHDAARAAEGRPIRFYLFGATEEVNARVCQRVRELYPSLELAGGHHGYVGVADEEDLLEEIRHANTDILWVGLGVPRQEAFCVRNRDRLQGLTWLITCGGLYDFIVGKNSRAPQWMQDRGLEWAYRTILEPRRLLWRYLTTNPHAMWRMALNTREIPEAGEKTK